MGGYKLIKCAHIDGRNIEEGRGANKNMSPIYKKREKS